MPMPFSSPDDVRPEVAAFEPYEPGLSIEDIRRRYHLERVIKMASNENPLGVSPVVRAALERGAASVFRYPQAGNPRLVEALAARLGVEPARIFVGNGSDEVIDLLFRVRAVPGEHNAVAFRPCFGLYVTQARLAGVELRRAPLNDDFSFNFDGLLERVDANTTLVFITSPDNPSGRLAPARELLRVARALPPACLLVVDEAYIDFAGMDDADEKESLLRHLDKTPNLALLRTFSKVYGLAGLRVGYGILPPRLAEYMWRVRLPFSVNLLAEQAAIAALGDESFHSLTRRVTAEGRAVLSEGLRALGCAVLPSHANFLMFAPPKAGPDARALHQALLERGVIVRGLGGYHLPDWLRVSVGTDDENRCFLAACADILRPCSLRR
ncbi:MAG: histidinol-phosphate transaminase [Desulfovibrionaceae bacterium]|nr:histidinol-phosphate transaminase [Desulfovibrionaceae bacterium]